MNTHVLLLVGYSVALVALGLAVSRRVQSAASFFVANRQLSAVLIFATVLAANIGAGSTVGATGLGYRDGISAWWWNGSAAIGSVLLAFWIAPRVWRQASAHGFLTTGDLLEHHFGSRVRGLVAGMVWLATLSILAGQLIGIAWILNVVAGLPKWAGCLIGGGLMTAYFAAGGLLSSAWVNLVQLSVLLVGFAITVPAAISRVGGLPALARVAQGEGHAQFWNGATSVSYLVLLVPAFMISPGLLQKAFGAKSEQAARRGIAWNAAVLFVFACVPALLGLAAHVHHAGLRQELALPTLLARDLPVGLGSILLAAIFSAEVSTADAVLFMLATSLSQDLYRRFVNPSASDGQVLRVATVGGGGGRRARHPDRARHADHRRRPERLLCHARRDALRADPRRAACAGGSARGGDGVHRGRCRRGPGACSLRSGTGPAASGHPRPSACSPPRSPMQRPSSYGLQLGSGLKTRHNACSWGQVSEART